MSNLQDVPDDRACKAKTRAGTPCKNWGMWPSGRCRMHGGKSYGGIASPTITHGWYSTYWPYTSWRAREKARIRSERRVAARLAEIEAKERVRAEREAAREAALRRRCARINHTELVALLLGETASDGDRARDDGGTGEIGPTR